MRTTALLTLLSFLCLASAAYASVEEMATDVFTKGQDPNFIKRNAATLSNLVP